MNNGVKNKSKIKEWCVFLYVLFILICFYPYEFYSVYFTFLPDKSYFLGFAYCFTTFFITVLIHRNTKASNYLMPVALTQFLGFFLVYIAQGNIRNAFSTGVWITLAFLLVLMIDKSVGLLSFIKKYDKWILLMAIMGSVAWGLVTFAGMSPISFVYDRADEREIWNYGLTFSKTIQYGFRTIRYSGFFDEPGAMGYWGIYALLFNKVFVKSKYVEWALIITLFFTFSMGFYIQLAVYLLVFNLNNLRRAIVTVILVVLVFQILDQTKGTEYDRFYKTTIGRIEKIYETSESTGSMLETDNRADLTKLAKKEFMENPLFGSSNNEYILDNIYEPLARYGIVGSVLILYPFLMLLFGAQMRHDTDVFRMMFVLCVGFIHRPFHNFLLYYFILYCIIVLVKQRWALGLHKTRHYL